MRANLILGIGGSLFTLTLLFELLRRKHLREKYAILWVGVAGMTLFVAAVPQVSSGLRTSSAFPYLQTSCSSWRA